ncbi:7-deoxyloganetin glucosyltransferase-like [Iris pallida]|uniref:Glycosyltransferase n=1 Tax=Iris pallida TaxID=29817 RepID=A0AAX6FIM3_IRIPA|nr:7-deoxyloganetin glucosyltransferase-like [Iris pallida]
MGSVGGTKPHAVCIPCPSQGHINAMLKLANLLHFKGFHVTFVHTEFNYKRVANAAAAGSSVIGSVDSFRYEAIPDGLPITSDLNSSQDLRSLCTSIRDGSLDGPFRDLLERLNEPSSGVPPVTCIVSDSFMSFTAGVAKEFEIPDVFFCSTSACGFMGFYHYKELVERGIVPLKSEDDLVNGYLDSTVIDWMPGMPNMRLRDLPSFIRTTDPDEVVFNFALNEAQASHRATAIIVNSFDDLEGPVLDEMSSTFGAVYPIGPLNLLCSQAFGTMPESARSSMWKEDSACLDWLEGREANSVIYVNFGSLATMTGQQLTEFAWGLANSGHDFLWIIRPDALVVDESAALSREFLAETSGRGFLASWCPQEDVLGHPSIGGFLTHCGWNSTMEAISSGVPMICWPFFADQQPNCRFLCVEWGVGMEVDDDVKREKVEEMVRELLVGEKGAEMRRKASQWKERAIRATEPGGKSFIKFEEVVKDVLSGGNVFY